MPFPRYIDGPWNLLKDKINAIGDYFETAVATMVGKVRNSITTDIDDKAQLVNDLADSELLPDLVYGTDSNGVRGWKPEGGGGLSSGLDTNKPPAGNADLLYYATDTKILYRDTGTIWEEIARGETATRLAQLSERAHASLTGIGANDHHAQVHGDTDHSTLPIYPVSFNAVWAAGYTGNLHFHLKVSPNADLSAPVVNVESKDAQTNWIYDNGVAWVAIPVAGVDVIFAGHRIAFKVLATLNRGTLYYLYIRQYQVGNTAYENPIFGTLVI